MTLSRWTIALLAIAAVGAGSAWGMRKKKKSQAEDLPNQVLELPKDPPAAVAVDASRLLFRVTPLSSKGLLSQQVRDGLKAVLRDRHREVPVKLRAFVAGSGDVRRVQTIVSETFSDKKLPLPALSVIQVGGLPQQGAQVVIEVIDLVAKPVNPNGLVFFSAQQASSPRMLQPVAPLAEKALAKLAAAVKAAGSAPADMLRVTCYLSSLDEITKIRPSAVSMFPSAAWDFVQLERAPVRTVAACDGVARLNRVPAGEMRMVQAPALPGVPGEASMALVGPGKLAISSTQLAFRFQDSDIRLAFQRLDHALEDVHTGASNVAMVHFYVLSQPMEEKLRSARFEFLNRRQPPATTMLVY